MMQQRLSCWFPFKPTSKWVPTPKGHTAEPKVSSGFGRIFQLRTLQVLVVLKTRFFGEPGFLGEPPERQKGGLLVLRNSTAESKGSWAAQVLCNMVVLFGLCGEPLSQTAQTMLPGLLERPSPKAGGDRGVSFYRFFFLGRVRLQKKGYPCSNLSSGGPRWGEGGGDQAWAGEKSWAEPGAPLLEISPKACRQQDDDFCGCRKYNLWEAQF